MKSLLFFVSILISSNAFAYTFENSGCTRDQLRATKQAWDVAKDRFDVGEITKTQVTKAEFEYKSTLYCSDQPDPVLVSCDELTRLQQLIINGSREELNVAYITKAEYGEQLKLGGALFIYCDGRN